MKKSVSTLMLMTLLLTSLIVIFIQGCSKVPDELNLLPGGNVIKEAAAVSQTGLQYVPNEVLVKFKAGKHLQRVLLLSAG
jgi:hypothetical protein